MVKRKWMFMGWMDICGSSKKWKFIKYEMIKRKWMFNNIIVQHNT